jgi:hypothetical protein
MENFKMIAEHFRQDVREFWTRANFFLVTQTGLFSAFFVIFHNLPVDNVSIILIVPIFGLIMAIFWFFVLRGAVFWIKKWREQVIKLSNELDRFHCYAEVENLVNEKKFLSPSNITQFLPLGFACVWGALLILIVLKTAFKISI